jgi:hypothetical protein
MAGLRYVVAAATLVACFAVSASASRSVSPGQVLSSALSAARTQKSVHYVSQQTGSGVRVTMVGDAAVNEGRQLITFQKGSQVGHVTVLVVANTAYVRGDAFTLMNYMGFPAATAAAMAGRWLELAHTAPDFATVAAGVRLVSTVNEISMERPLSSLGVSTVRGQRVLGLRAHETHAGKTATDTLYIRDTGTPLPVEQIVTLGKTVPLDVVFTRWNESVALAASKSAVSLS